MCIPAVHGVLGRTDRTLYLHGPFVIDMLSTSQLLIISLFRAIFPIQAQRTISPQTLAHTYKAISAIIIDLHIIGSGVELGLDEQVKSHETPSIEGNYNENVTREAMNPPVRKIETYIDITGINHQISTPWKAAPRPPSLSSRASVRSYQNPYQCLPISAAKVITVSKGLQRRRKGERALFERSTLEISGLPQLGISFYLYDTRSSILKHGSSPLLICAGLHVLQVLGTATGIKYPPVRRKFCTWQKGAQRSRARLLCALGAIFLLIRK
ncbi:hypothetical protein F5884DRAFT_833582 [Xylogone sp. PMI_703]|nr:hypothetical protein F5884DRAFT_833582 [Xylogone sp. PMI_703]